MKKSLADFTPVSDDKAPEQSTSFGAFKSFKDGQATIDLEVLRKI